MRARRARAAPCETRARRAPHTALAVGSTSFAYHASYTWFFQWFDFVGMYVFLCLPLAINLEVLGVFSKKNVSPGIRSLNFLFLARSTTPPKCCAQNRWHGTLRSVRGDTEAHATSVQLFGVASVFAAEAFYWCSVAALALLTVVFYWLNIKFQVRCARRRRRRASQRPRRVARS